MTSFSLSGNPQEIIALISMGIVFLITFPILIGVGIYQNNRNRMRHIFITFSGPDGTIRKVQMKIGISWTIYFFGQWALLFRGQFIEWIILFFATLATSTVIAFNFKAGNPSPSPLPEIGSTMKWFNWLLIVAALLFESLLKTYFILIGNRRRLQKMHAQGYSFDNGLNTDVQGIYDYIKKPSSSTASFLSKDEIKPLGENEVQGKTHKYVVPEKTEEDKNDYSNLTLQDLKLLLRSDGIPFDAKSTKEELLELIKENIKEEDESFDQDELSSLSMQDLKLLLKMDGVPFEPSMKKEDLVELAKKNKKNK